MRRGPVRRVRRGFAASLALLLAASVLAVVAGPVDRAGAQTPAAVVVDVPHDWALIPDGVEVGDEFRLVFVTQERRNASSSNIADYDSFVRTSAGSSSAHAALRAYSQHFKALGSTSSVHARDHLGMHPDNADHQDVPVYWVGGPRAAAGNFAVFSSTRFGENGIGWEADGRYASGAVVPSSGTSRRVWTGSRENGAGRGATAVFGQIGVGWGLAGRTPDHIHSGTGVVAAGTNYSLYGVSAVFRVVAGRLVSNLGQADGSSSLLEHFDYAQAFTSGGAAHGYTLDGVDIEFARLSNSSVFSSSKLTVTVRADSGGSPGAVVATLTNPAYQATSTDRVFGFDAPAGGVALEADSTYWVVLDRSGAVSGLNTLRRTNSASEDGGAASGFSIADTRRFKGRSESGWRVPASGSYKIAVRGAVNPPPPPMPEADGVFVVPHDWELVPSGLDSGDEFRLLFVTMTRRNATSSDIADYDSFVQSSAAGSLAGGSLPAIQPYASLFKALGSTSTVDARDHLGMNPDNSAHNNAHVYWLNGGRIAYGNADVWDGAWTNVGLANTRTQLGTANSVGTVFTGSNTDGTKHATRFLGAGHPTPVSTGGTRVGDNPIARSAALPGNYFLFYGVSPVFRVGLVPVPVSVDLSGVGSSVVERIEGRSVPFRVGLSRPLSAGESVSVPLVVSGASDVVNDFGVELTAGATNTGVSLDLSVAGGPFVVFEGAGAHAASVDLTLTEDGVAESGSERLTVSLGSASDFASQVSVGHTNVAGGAVRGRSTRFRVDVFDAGVRPWVQFRTCPQGVSCSAGSSTGWVATSEGDALPVVSLFEGGSDVSYQFRLRAPQVAEFGEAWVQVARAHGGHMGVGTQDSDRLICRSPSNRHVSIGGQLLGQTGVGGNPAVPLNFRPHDASSGCPHPIVFFGGGDKDDWQTVTVGSGDDPDAFDHSTHLVHRAGMSGPSGRIDAGFGDVRLPVHIADDDAWEQDLEISVDGGTTWTAAADGGFGAALNVALTAGEVHSFRVRLANDPASIPRGATQVFFTVSACTGDLRAPDSSQEFRGLNRFRCLGPSYEVRISSSGDPSPTASERIGVTYGSPVTVNVHVDEGYLGPVHFTVHAVNLWRRTDTDMPAHAAAPASYRTQPFTYLKRFTACAGCVSGFERSIYFARSDSTGIGGTGGTQGAVGELTAFDLSDTGIGLRWPAVTGADAYQVRWWPTVSATPGTPASASYVSALVQHPGHVLDGLEPATQYRARVYYFADGGVLLGSASPTIRFTTLPAGSPTQAAPTSPVLEPVPVASIAADGGNVVEGGTAAFTVTLTPPPTEPVTVNVEVGHYGDGSLIADADAGARTVTVPTSGTARFTVTTLDNTSPDANGPIHADVTAGDGYRLHQFDSRAVVFVDNDDDPKAEVTTIGVSEVTDTTATIVWAARGDGAKYQVGWYQSPGIPRLKYATTDGTSHQISGLEPESGYQVFVIASRGAAIIGTYTISVATLAGGETKTAEVDVTLPPPTPEVSITADTAAVTEGGTAAFTITAEPAPESDLQVAVTVAQSGDWGAAAGRKIVTIGTSGTATLTVATADDSADEPDGSVTAVVDDDYGYTVDPDKATATVAVADDDVPRVSVTAAGGITEGGDAVFTVTASPVPHSSLQIAVAVTQHGDWGAAVGQRTVVVGSAGTATLTVATANDDADEPDGTVTAAIGTGSGYTVSPTAHTATVAVADDDLPPVPEVSIAADSAAIAEGGDATFTVTADPAPAADLAVTVTVTQTGDYTAAAGQQTVTIGASGTATLTVATTDDGADEADGSVTATLDTPAADGGYTVSASQSTAAVAVADDDVPQVTITAAGDITEGANAGFTVTASPTPHSDLRVAVTVAQTGDYGATVGQKTVTIGTSGAATLTVATADDSTDEPDGAITATLAAGTDYDLGTPSAATVTVADDDDAPVEPDKDKEPDAELTVTVEDATGTEGDVVEFRIILSRALTEELEVSWNAGTAWHLRDNQAHSSDYWAMSGTMVFAPGTTEMTEEIWLKQDSHKEPDEHFSVEAYLPGSWRRPDATGTMTITDDD